MGQATYTIGGIGNGTQTVVFETLNGPINGVVSATGSNSPITGVLNGNSNFTQPNLIAITVGPPITYSFGTGITGNANVQAWTNETSVNSRLALITATTLYIITSPGTVAATAASYSLTIANGLITAVGTGATVSNFTMTLVGVVGDICVRAGALVHADQGFVPIEHLDPRKHTIGGGQRIVAVTKAKALNNKNLVLFKMHALGFNVPACDTYLTLGHKVHGVEAQVWATRNKLSIILVDYNTDEYLYNVLLETYGVMKVNNMLMETLHPSNPIAKLYL